MWHTINHLRQAKWSNLEMKNDDFSVSPLADRHSSDSDPCFSEFSGIAFFLGRLGRLSVLVLPTDPPLPQKNVSKHNISPKKRLKRIAKSPDPGTVTSGSY